MLRNLTITLTGWVAVSLLTACISDPLANVPRLADVDVADPSPVVEAVAAPEETDENVGFFQRILRKREVPADVAAAAEPVAPVKKQGDETPARIEEAGAAKEETIQPDSKKRGLFGWGAGRKVDADATVKMASLDQPATASETGEAQARSGLFSRAKARQLTGNKGPDLRDAQPGEVLPFGEIARACHVKRGQMGQVVAKYPERGAKYKVYDSAPGNLGLHTFYVTGFRDGCPRQVTAALAVFGSPGMYEALRYGLPVKARSKKPTDRAYEKVKSQICGVSRTKPCGTKISRMEKSTAFLSLYNRFEGAQGWTNLLLSEGQVMAKDVEG